MKGDINIRYGPQLEQAINRVAASQRMDRADMLRAIATEAVEAHDAGRLRFPADEKPRIDSSLNALAIQLGEAVVELERSQRANISREKRLRDAFVASETAVREAHQTIVDRIVKSNVASYQPFVTKVTETNDALATIGDRLTDTQQAGFRSISDHLESVVREARAARTQYNLVLGDDRTLSAKFLLILFASAMVLGVLAFLWLATLAQPIGRFVAQRMIADSESICLVLNDRYAVDDCKIPEEDRDLALRVIQARDKRK